MSSFPPSPSIESDLLPGAVPPACRDRHPALEPVPCRRSRTARPRMAISSASRRSGTSSCSICSRFRRRPIRLAHRCAVRRAHLRADPLRASRSAWRGFARSPASSRCCGSVPRPSPLPILFRRRCGSRCCSSLHRCLFCEHWSARARSPSGTRFFSGSACDHGPRFPPKLKLRRGPERDALNLPTA